MLVCNISQRPRGRSTLTAGIAAGIGAAFGVGANAGIATTIGTAAGTGAAAGVGAVVSTGTTVGTASGTSAASGVGAKIVAAVGTAAGSGTGAATGDTAGALWTPATLGSALRAWYKFDTLTGSNGSAQSTLTDASGNGFTPTVLAAATLAAADLNGLNTLKFAAVNAQCYILASTIMSGSAAGSCYLVYKVVSESANTGLMDWGSSGNDNHWPYLDGTLYIDFGSTARKTVGNPTPVLTTYRIISIYSAANDWAFYIDGGTGGSSGGTSPFNSTGTNTVGWKSGTTYLGRNTGSAFLDGNIAELFFTNAKQTTADWQKAEGYLAWKWGLTGNLDSTHPYKSVQP